MVLIRAEMFARFTYYALTQFKTERVLTTFEVEVDNCFLTDVSRITVEELWEFEICAALNLEWRLEPNDGI